MRKANIIITGTPGTGKSSHSALIKEKLGDEMKIISINEFAKEHDCFCGYDEERKSQIVDEDRVADAIENCLQDGGYIIDWHVCDIFPEDLIDLVVVLRTDNTVLYDRLQSRNYSQSKIDENIDAEIMQVILEDANGAYEKDIIVELESNSIDDLESNVDRIVQWKAQWDKDNRDDE